MPEKKSTERGTLEPWNLGTFLKITRRREAHDSPGCESGSNDSARRSLGGQSSDQTEASVHGLSRGQCKHGVAIARGVNRIDGTGESVMAHLGHFGQLCLVESGVGRDNSQRRVLEPSR